MKQKYWLVIGFIVSFSLTSCSTMVIDHLIKTAEAGHTQMVSRYIKTGIDLNEKGSTGHTVLHKAVITDQREVVTLLLNAGVDTGIRGPLNTSLLTLAVLAHRFEMAHYLIERGIDNSSEALRETLKLSLKFKLPEATSFILDTLNADISGDDEILLIALKVKQWDLVPTLIKKGLDPKVRDKISGKSSLCFIEGNVPLAQLLLNAGANVNNIPKNGMPVLTQAILDRREKLMDLYLQAGAEVNPRYENPEERFSTPLSPLIALAASSISTPIPIAQILLERGADINYIAISDEGHSVTPLVMAILNKQVELCDFLLKNGADPTLATDIGTPKVLAIASGIPELIALFK